MDWTTDKPTVDGWYWVKFKNSAEAICLNIELDRYPNIDPPGTLCYEAYANGYECEYDFDLNTEAELFYGPIEPPHLWTGEPGIPHRRGGEPELANV